MPHRVSAMGSSRCQQSKQEVLPSSTMPCHQGHISHTSRQRWLGTTAHQPHHIHRYVLFVSDEVPNNQRPEVAQRLQTSSRPGGNSFQPITWSTSSTSRIHQHGADSCTDATIFPTACGQPRHPEPSPTSQCYADKKQPQWKWEHLPKSTDRNTRVTIYHYQGCRYEWDPEHTKVLEHADVHQLIALTFCKVYLTRFLQLSFKAQRTWVRDTERGQSTCSHSTDLDDRVLQTSFTEVNIDPHYTIHGRLSPGQQLPPWHHEWDQFRWALFWSFMWIIMTVMIIHIHHKHHSYDTHATEKYVNIPSEK